MHTHIRTRKHRIFQPRTDGKGLGPGQPQEEWKGVSDIVGAGLETKDGGGKGELRRLVA